MDSRGQEKHPVSFTICLLTLAKQNYSTWETEALAVRFTSKIFRIYLLSLISLTLITDYQALFYAFQKEHIHGRLSLWFDTIAEYRFAVEFWAGCKIEAADYLSRLVSNFGTAQNNATDESDLTLLASQFFLDTEASSWKEELLYIL